MSPQLFLKRRVCDGMIARVFPFRGSSHLVTVCILLVCIHSNWILSQHRLQEAPLTSVQRVSQQEIVTVIVRVYIVGVHPEKLDFDPTWPPGGFIDYGY